MNILDYWGKLTDIIQMVPLFESILFSISLVMLGLIYLKSRHERITDLVWLYSSFIPAFIILFLNHNKSVFISTIYLSIQCLFVYLYIKNIIKNYKKIVNNSHNVLTKVKNVENSNYGKQKSLEYVGLFILPFITVNNSVSVFTVVFIFTVVTIIIKRFELYYLNLPILLFFKLQKIESNRRVKMTVITPRNFTFIEGEEYNIRSFIKKLNLYIIISSVD